MELDGGPKEKGAARQMPREVAAETNAEPTDASLTDGTNEWQWLWLWPSLAIAMAVSAQSYCYGCGYENGYGYGYGSP